MKIPETIAAKIAAKKATVLYSYKPEIQMRLDEIISELNALAIASQDLEGWGATDLDMALDFRRDAWEGDGDCPEPTPEELEQIASECERNVKRLTENDAKSDRLFSEYCDLAGTAPHYYELTGTYARSWHEKL